MSKKHLDERDMIAEHSVAGTHDETSDVEVEQTSRDDSCSAIVTIETHHRVTATAHQPRQHH
jgi:hypothetical protein